MHDVPPVPKARSPAGEAQVCDDRKATRNLRADVHWPRWDG
jgi:hypothetical protein